MSYRVLLAGTHYLEELVDSISLEDSLDEISYRATIKLAITPDLPDITPGQEIRILGIPPGSTTLSTLLAGVVWECEENTNQSRRLTVTVYDRTIYLAKSDDERLMPAGQTASQRLKAYAQDWSIPISSIQDTKIALARDVKRTQSIYAMIAADLKETVDKGGDMFRPRMTPAGLELYKLGSNAWDLEVIEETTRRKSLEGAATVVKVLGTEQKSSPAADDTSGMTLEEIARKYAGSLNEDGKITTPELPSPVLAIVKGDTAKLGTIQKVLQDSKIKSLDQATKAGRKELAGVQETLSANGIDINTIRAGDVVRLNDTQLYVTRVRHDLGDPGHMELELAAEEKVRRDFYHV